MALTVGCLFAVVTGKGSQLGLNGITVILFTCLVAVVWFSCWMVQWNDE